MILTGNAISMPLKTGTTVTMGIWLNAGSCRSRLQFARPTAGQDKDMGRLAVARSGTTNTAHPCSIGRAPHLIDTTASGTAMGLVLGMPKTEDDSRRNQGSHQYRIDHVTLRTRSLMSRDPAQTQRLIV